MIFETFEREFKKLDPVFMNLEWENSHVYALFLAQVYYYVNHTSRIMSAVASRIPHDREEIHSFILKHANEEKGHQFLAKQDLKFLGYTLEALPELTSTRMFYEPQYYKAQYVNPIGFYGYALALEGTAIKRLKEVYARCKGVYGEKACNFLRVHAEEDDEHVKDSLQLLDRLPESDILSIESNLVQSIDALVLMINEISSSIRLKKSA